MKPLASAILTAALLASACTADEDPSIVADSGTPATTEPDTATTGPTNPGSATVTVAPTAPGTEAEPSPSNEPGSTNTPTTPPPEPAASADAAIAVAHGYIDAVAEGDLEAAWGLVARPSREAFGGFERFESLRSGLSEGIGAWSAAEDLQVFAMPIAETTGVADAWAVTLLGTVPLEGPPSLHATSLVVYVPESFEGAQVSPFEGVLGENGFVAFDPSPGAALTEGQPVLVEVPDGIGSSAAFSDDQPSDLVVFDEPDRVLPRLEVVPPEPLDPGPHATTIVLTSTDGRLFSTATAHLTP